MLRMLGWMGLPLLDPDSHLTATGMQPRRMPVSIMPWYHSKLLSIQSSKYAFKRVLPSAVSLSAWTGLASLSASPKAMSVASCQQEDFLWEPPFTSIAHLRLCLLTIRSHRENLTVARPTSESCACKFVWSYVPPTWNNPVWVTYHITNAQYAVLFAKNKLTFVV